MTVLTIHDSVTLNTPLGELGFMVHLNEASPNDVDGAFDLLLGPLEPSLPPGMSVQACCGVVLKVRPTRPLSNLCFECRWLNTNPKCTGPETGEGLDAQRWESAGHLLLVGTEDQEFMTSLLLPAVVLVKGEAGYAVRHSKSGMAIQVHALPDAVPISLHFFFAWNQDPEPADCSCWYAVDIPHQTVLSQVGKG